MFFPPVLPRTLCIAGGGSLKPRLGFRLLKNEMKIDFFGLIHFLPKPNSPQHVYFSESFTGRSNIWSVSGFRIRWLENTLTPTWRGSSCWLNPKESATKVHQRPPGVTTSLTLLGPVSVWSQQNCQWLLLTVLCFVTWDCNLTELQRINATLEMKEWMNLSVEATWSQ